MNFKDSEVYVVINNTSGKPILSSRATADTLNCALLLPSSSMEALIFRYLPVPSDFGIGSPNYQITSRVITATKGGIKHSI